MNIGQMKNIVVLKDIPSNIVDEAIVILKNNSNVNKKELIRNKKSNRDNESPDKNYDFVVNEAENVIKDYIRNLEKPKETKVSLNKILVKYRKLQIYSFLLGIIAIVGILVSIIK